MSFCTWTDPVSGESFNLNGMTQKDSGRGWVVNPKEHPEQVYYTNICTEVSHECHGAESSGPAVATQFQDNKCVSALGMVANPEWSLIDPSNPEAGVQVKWGGGDPCPPKPGREILIKVRCDRSMSRTEIEQASEPEMCNYEINFKGPDGCPGHVPDELSGSWTFVIFVIVSFCLYCGIGTLYNVKYHNLQGIEALPNSAFWVEFPTYVKTGCNFSYEKAMEMKNKYTGNGGYTNPDFDDIDDDAY